MTQDRALDILKTGANVFLTGEPGSGKTHVINEYISWLEAAKLNVAVTASTGIAATHIGGMTIHSWSGIGVRDSLDRAGLEQIVGKEKIVKRFKKVNVLIIDEISMLDAKQLDMVEVVGRTIRQSEEAFGGIQVVFVGDFFQLPPITRHGEVMRYAFASHTWDRTKPLVCYLGEQHRQEDDTLLGLLNSIRKNQIEDDHFTLLSEQTEISFEGIEPTRLYTHNADVDVVNAGKLNELSGTSRNFSMSGKGSKPLREMLTKNCLSPETLSLKEDAMVMFTKNNFDEGYVNGTLGRVVGFTSVEGYPIVETTEGDKIEVEPVNWEVVEDGKVLAAVTQIPLRLAWAITVHKSQGMSLDAASVDLSKAFVYGQGYVALSRVRSLKGLKVEGMNANALTVDPRVVGRDEDFRKESDAAEETFTELEGEELVEMQKRFVASNQGRWPNVDDIVAAASGVARLKKQSTENETKEQILSGKTVKEIAQNRGLVESTIWGHVEKLAESGGVSLPEVKRLFPTGADWEQAVVDIEKAIKENGHERLKPLFDFNNEKYDYDTIRLVRLLHILKSVD